MAQEILVSIVVESGKADAALAKNSKSIRDNSKAVGDNKKQVNSLAAAKKRLEKLQKQEAVDIEIVNQKIKIQKSLNEAAAKSHLGLSNAKKEETAVDRQLRKAEEKLAFLRSDEAMKLQRINEQIKIQNDLNTALVRSELGVASSKAAVNAQQKQFRTQSGLNNAILLETGRLATDASYGFTAIANNLSQIVSLSSSFIDTTGSIKESFKQLGRSLMGTGGVLLGVQILIGLMQTKTFQDFVKRISGITEAMDLMNETLKEASKGVSDLNGSFEIYLRTIKDINTPQEEYNAAVALLIEEYPDFVEQLMNAGVTLNDLTEGTKEAITQTELYRDSIVELAMSRAAMTKIEELAGKQLDNRIKKEQEARAAGFKDLNEAEEFYAKENERRTKNALHRTARVGEANSTLIQTYRTAEDEKFDTVSKILGIGSKEQEEIEEQIGLLSQYINLGLDLGKRKGDKDKPVDFSEIDVDLSIDEDDRDFSIAELFKRTYYPEDFQDQLEIIPEFIEDADEYAENFAKEKAKTSLISKIFKLEPKSREKDLKDLERSLEKFGSTTIKETDEYRNAVTAINDKWDAIDKEKREKRDKVEREAKAKHLQFLLNNTADFLKSAAQLNEENKDLARASIIASSAAASVGIWQSYFDLKAPEKGSLALIGTGIAQAGLILSTANALKSLNSDSPLSSTSPSSNVQAPAFNVVGESPLDLLLVDISNKLEKPIPAYVTAKGAIETLDEYYRNVRTGSNRS